MGGILQEKTTMKDLIIDCFAGGGGASVGIEMALGIDDSGEQLRFA